ncbi:MAG TPA: DUF2157 domain-containing protein [Bacteroidia bacterium]|nr:DUF2157 domain-containing protein [Bacteroidia bacterium]
MNFEEALADKLKASGLLNEAQAQKISDYSNNKLFSLNFELRTLLYCGVLLATTGFGIVIYKNIDSIGHNIIIGIIAVLCSGCFMYCFRRRVPYSNLRTESPDAFFDYVLLSACLLFLALEGYLQFQHHIFGERYGIATLIPAVLFFGLAYLFDHKGVLSMGITALCAWIGITVTPLDLLSKNDFSGERFIYSALSVGIVLMAAAFFSDERNIKKHFSFTYLNFASNMMFIAALSGIFSMEWGIIYLLLLGALIYYYIRYARKEKSFYFLLISVIYGYIGFTWELFHLLDKAGLDFTFSILSFVYFILSCMMIIKFLKSYKTFFKTDDHIQ